MSTIVFDTPEKLAVDEPAFGLLAGPAAREGDWRAEHRPAAWQKFAGLPMPARTDQAWRFSSLKALDLGPYRAGRAAERRGAGEPARALGRVSRRRPGG